MIKLGIIGLSNANGHPYSWSAIFNGYNKDYMKQCPFPVIPKYLYKQNYPEDFLQNARVTHIWTQDREISEQVAKASEIENIAETFTDLIGKVDGVLLARDDSENHKKFVTSFIEAGMPIYIDKPIAVDRVQLDYFKTLEQYPNQIFSCSVETFKERYARLCHKGLLLEEDEIYAHQAFLFSEESVGMTGHNPGVDRGWTV